MDKFTVKEEKMLLDEACSKLRDNDYTNVRALLTDGRAKQGKQVTYDILLATFLANPSKGIDWYSVLQISPSADAATIDMQYKRLVSLLEPIKMGFFGAETALCKVKEAHAVLSDPSRRALFDRERNYNNDMNEQVTLWRQHKERTSAVGVEDDSSKASEFVVPYSPEPCEFETPLDKLLFEEAFGDKRKELDEVIIQEKKAKITRNDSDTKLRAEETFGTNKKKDSDELVRIQEEKPKASVDESGVIVRNIKTVPESANLVELDGKNDNDAAPPHQMINNQNTRVSVEDIEAGSVWAVYDISRDSMPRLYARVCYVVSPTKVSVRFLVPHPSYPGEEQWLKDGLPFACGIFMCRNSMEVLDITRFLHTITYETKEALFRILPCKGEIWAAYTKWSNKWKLRDFSTCQYQVVEILSDYTEDKGITIRSLFNLDNKFTFFHRQSPNGFFYVKDVPKSEILSFSHRIPAYKIDDSKERGFQGELLYLESDALPLNIARL